MVSKVKASGGKERHGGLRRDVNQYLKWAFIGAGSVVARQRNSERFQGLHVVRLDNRVRGRKGHCKAVGAVARHLCEAAYWMTKRGQPYKEPKGEAGVQEPSWPHPFGKAGCKQDEKGEKEQESGLPRPG